MKLLAASAASWLPARFLSGCAPAEQGDVQTGEAADTQTPGATPPAPEPQPAPLPAEIACERPAQPGRAFTALRDFSSTSQTFWCCDRSNAGGRLGVLIDGKTLFEGDFLIAENDFTGLVTAHGLKPGRHRYQIMIDSDPVTGTYCFQTAPQPGEDFDLLYIGDSTSKVSEAFQQILSRKGKTAFVFSTEVYYNDNSGLYGGKLYADENNLLPSGDHPQSYLKTLNGDGVSVGFRHKYRQALVDEPYRHEAMNTWPIFNMPDNHDMGAGPMPVLSGTVRYDAAHKALFEYPSNGNPQTSDPDIDSVPTPVLYFNKVIGDVEIIVPDMLSYSAPFGAGYMSGSFGNGTGEDKQVAWFKRRLVESQARFIILLLAKPHRGEEWSDPDNGLLRLIDGIDKTVIAITANTHNHYAQLVRWRMPNRPMLEVGASSFSAVGSSSGFWSAKENLIYFSNAHFQTALKEPYLGGTVLRVQSTQQMRANRKVNVTTDRGAETVLIREVIGGDSIMLAQPLLGRAGTGSVVYYYDWSDSADVVQNPASTLCCYGKVMVRPRGTQDHPYAHLAVQIVQTFTGKIIWQGVIKENERTPGNIIYSPVI